MGYDIERATPCRVVLTATVGSGEVHEEREHVVAGFVRAARIDGFRKGKAPRTLVERRFANEIREDLEEHLTRRTWEQVRSEEKLRPASPLGIRESTWLESGEFRVKGEFDVYPTVELAGLDGFTPPAFDLKPTDEDLAAAMLQLQERQAVWEPVEGEPAAEGMLVEAEVHGEFPEGGGEPFHEERSLFQLGRDEVYPEIEAAVSGHGVGEDVAAERTIGDEGGRSARGRGPPTAYGSRACGASDSLRQTTALPNPWASRRGSRHYGSACGNACVPRTPTDGAMRGAKR